MDRETIVRKWQEMSLHDFQRLCRDDIREDLLDSFDAEAARRSQNVPASLCDKVDATVSAIQETLLKEWRYLSFSELATLDETMMDDETRRLYCEETERRKRLGGVTDCRNDAYNHELQNGRRNLLLLLAVFSFCILLAYVFQIFLLPRLLWFMLWVAITFLVVSIVVPRLRSGSDDEGASFRARILLVILLSGGPIPFWLLFIPELVSHKIENDGRARPNPQKPLALVENVRTCLNYREYQVMSKALEYAERLVNESPDVVIRSAKAYQDALESVRLKNLFASHFQQEAAKYGYQIRTETKVIRVPVIGF